MLQDGIRQLRCPSCNSIDFVEEGRFYVCQYCGGKLDRGSCAITATVSTADSVSELLSRANLYWDLGNTDRARQLYRQVLDIDATNEIARQRL